jgi:hypothetical protein
MSSYVMDKLVTFYPAVLYVENDTIKIALT